MSVRLTPVRGVRVVSGALKSQSGSQAPLGGDSHEKDSGSPEACGKCWMLLLMILAAVLGFELLFGDKTEPRATALAPYYTKWPLEALSLQKHFALEFVESMNATETEEKRVVLKTHSMWHSLASRSHESQSSDALFDLCLLCALIAVIGSIKAPRRGPLYTLSLNTLLSFATALNCVINLDQATNYNGYVQCDAGCDSCKFTLNYDKFRYGTAKCTPNVPCFVELFGTSADMDFSTVNGSLASALSVKVDGGYYPFDSAHFYAPNGGSFQFEATNTQTAVSLTTFHAEYSKVVDIAFYDDHLDDPHLPELLAMYVYASNADKLMIFLGPDTRYVRSDVLQTKPESYIECPSAGLCQWTSFGKRYNDDVTLMRNVNILSFPGTLMRMFCDNNEEACDGVVVDCQTDICAMTFNTPSATWNCDTNSTCDNVDIETCAEGICAITTPTTTTLKPTTTTPVVEL